MLPQNLVQSPDRLCNNNVSNFGFTFAATLIMFVTFWFNNIKLLSFIMLFSLVRCYRNVSNLIVTFRNKESIIHIEYDVQIIWNLTSWFSSAMPLQVRYLQIAKKSKTYNPYRWVRYVTQANSYVARLWGNRSNRGGILILLVVWIAAPVFPDHQQAHTRLVLFFLL